MRKGRGTFARWSLQHLPLSLSNMNMAKHTSLVSSSVITPLRASLRRPPTSLWCSGTTSEACGSSAKPGPGFGARLLSVERDPGPLRAEGWERRVEGRGRRGRRAEAASSTVLDHLQRAPIPTERLDSSAERGREKGGVYEGRERGGKTGETRGKCEKRKERSGLGSNFFSHSLTLSLPLFSLPARRACTCPSYSRLHGDDLSVCWSRETWEICPAQRRRCASLELPLGAGMCVCMPCVCV